jgi:branched-chain amino acid transport system permease protein
LYLGIITFLSVLVFPDVILMTQQVTGGSLGLIGVPPFIAYGSTGVVVVPYEIVAAIALVSVVLIRALVVSGWGIRLKYLRDAPHALSTVGVSRTSTKLTVYVVSAIPAGLVGWAFAYINSSITYLSFGVSLTLILFAGAQLIGPGTIVGPIIGVGLLEGYSQFVGPFSQFNTLGLGVLLAVTVILFPGGLSKVLLRRYGQRLKPLLREHGSQQPVDANLSERNKRPAVTRVNSQPGDDGESKADGDKHAPESSPVLDVQNLFKSFGGNEAVHDVSFSAHSGKVLAVMGENGSGKTTLVNLISGSLSADSGQVLINGCPTTGLAAAQIAQLGCSRTFQIPQLVGELSVRENVEAGLLRLSCAGAATAILNPRRSRRYDRERRRAAEELCLRMGFSQRDMSTTVDKLPLGLRRLVEVARAAAAEGDIICLDEPAAGLTEVEMSELAQALRSFSRAGRTVLLIEHNVGFVLDLCDDILLMSKGRVEGIFRDVDRRSLPSALGQYLRRAPEWEKR